MIRDHAAGVNAPPTPPPVPIWHRWPCPLCGSLYRHPWHLAAHLIRADRFGHALDEQDAWTRAAAVGPVDVTPGTTDRRPLPVAPVGPPPALAAAR